MATGTRMTAKRVPTPSILSDAHPDHPCHQQCFLCKEQKVVYTHPTKWKKPELFSFLRAMEPAVEEDSCICQNCRDNIARGQRDPTKFHPRWIQQSQPQPENQICEVSGCNEPACRNTKLGDRELLRDLMNY